MTDSTTYPSRRSTRLKDWDYSKPGAYFVTIVTKDRQSLFGHIENDQMILNDIGNIVVETWEWLQNHHQNVELDANIVMPNHIHGIILLHDPDDDLRAAGAQKLNQTDATRRDGPHGDASYGNTSRGDVSRGDGSHGDASRGDDSHSRGDASYGDALRKDAACRDASRSVRTDAVPAHTSTATKQQGVARGRAPRKPLGRLIGAFKTVSTKRANQLEGTPGKVMWQGRFYDHIIRNEESLNALRQYVAENPAKWQEDQENPNRR